MPNAMEVARKELFNLERLRLRDEALKAERVARMARVNIDNVNGRADKLLGIPDFHQQMMALGCSVQCGGENNILMRYKPSSYTARIHDRASLAIALQRFGLL